MPEGGCNNKSCEVISPRVRKYTSDALICCDSEVSSRVVLLLLLQATVLLLRQRKDKHTAFRNAVMNVFFLFCFSSGGEQGRKNWMCNFSPSDQLAFSFIIYLLVQKPDWMLASRNAVCHQC